MAATKRDSFSCLSIFLLIALIAAMIFECSPRQEIKQQKIDSVAVLSAIEPSGAEVREKHLFVKVGKDIKMKNYFSFLDSLIAHYDTLPIKLTEYAVVHSNPWILDSLRGSDYYIQKRKGVFLYDQSEKVILHRGDSLIIPESSAVALIDKKFKSTILDLNIPEYTLRVIQLGDTILTSKVRVGRNDEEFLPIAGHMVDLRTPIGKGEIVRVERRPTYINPDTGERFAVTKRDDGRTTKMPIIPWIEPSINGIRYGALIHPTTNPNSLGKSYSHGCIGTTEADAWTIYYNSPIGTKVVFRYDLKIRDFRGDTIQLKDIYHLSKQRNQE
jgi:L,D-transpeptidase catalytic domain